MQGEFSAPPTAAPVQNAHPLQGAEPLVSVLVCTRDRKDDITITVRSVQACGYENFELLVLDQSESDATELAMAELCRTDPRLKYVRMPEPGKPGALNRGFELARGEFCFLTDDDCEVLPGWISAIVGAFQADARVGCVHGDVQPGPFEPADGYIPICRIEQEHTIYSLDEFAIMPNWRNFGIGANMAIRTDVVKAIHGCDPCIGPGAKFRTGDDTDMGVQLLRLGYGMHFCPAARVIHHGFRFWRFAKTDLERSGFCQGAIFTKHLRCGTYYRGAVHGLWESMTTVAKRALRGERPLGLTYPIFWVQGSLSTLRHPVDKSTHQFAPLSSDAARKFAHHVADVVSRPEHRKSSA